MNELLAIFQNNPIFQLFGLGTLFTILLYVSLLMIGSIRMKQTVNKVQQSELDTLVTQSNALIGIAKQEALEERAGWQGTRKFEIQKKVLEDDSEAICSFYLKPHDHKKLPHFKPGQFLTFHLKIPDSNVDTTIRCYSLSDAPTHDDYYRVSIKKQLPPRDESKSNINLSSSHYFHNLLKENDYIDVLAPSGEFYLDKNTDSPVVLIGGGIGLTPMISMLNYITDTQSTRETWFFYGLNNSSEHIWKEHLNTLRKLPNINIVICYSNPSDGDTLNTDDDKNGYDIKGWVGVPLFKKMLNNNNYDFYICGPPPMMNAVVNDLGEWGVSENNVHFEAFGPASIKKKNEEKTAPKVALEINFTRSDKTVIWDGSHDNLLKFAEANDVPLPSGCLAGNCGACKTAIRSGETKNIQKTSFKHEKGTCLACSCIPISSMSIDA